MRGAEVLIFLLVVLVIFGLSTGYILRRGTQALATHALLKSVFIVFIVFLALAYPAGRILRSGGGNGFSDILDRTGSLYMALMLHLVLLLAAADLLRLFGRFAGFFQTGSGTAFGKTSFPVFMGILGLAVAGVVGGYINASHPRTRNLEIGIDKAAGKTESLDIVVASDIHLGTIMGSRRLEKIVKRINSLNPDLVLFPGDIVDESVSRGEEEKMIDALRSVKARLGVFSVPGNHEWYGGLEKNLQYLRRGGVTVLQDEAVLLDGDFVLVGRQDPTAARFGKGRRRAIADILAGCGFPAGVPVILMDHQPVGLAEAEAAGVDLQISGHTHAGQLFPLNIINKRIYEQNWGYLRKGRMQVYVSCGVGTWGPAVRTGSVPEIVRIRVRFNPVHENPRT